MGRLVGMLRSDEAEERMPQPGLARLDEVVARVREAGIDVQVVIEGEPRALSAGMDVSAFRIVQEALTNTVRHSRSSRARVLLRWEPTVLEIQVADDGVGAQAGSAPREDGGGHGLVGIRERVALFGGVLATGRSDLGGYLLSARLPLSP
jgi:signal transduction histidine kinase